MSKAQRLMDYVATYPDTHIRFYASDMIPNIDSDVIIQYSIINCIYRINDEIIIFSYNSTLELISIIFVCRTDVILRYHCDKQEHIIIPFHLCIKVKSFRSIPMNFYFD